MQTGMEIQERKTTEEGARDVDEGARLEEYLSERCDHRPDEHEMIQGSETKRSERYPRKFVRRFIQALGNCKVESEEDVTGEDTSSDEEEGGEVKMRRMELEEEEEKAKEAEREEKLEEEEETIPEKKDEAKGEPVKVKEEGSTEKEASKQEEVKKEVEEKTTNVVQKVGAGVAALGKKIEEIGAECGKRNTAATDAEEIKVKREVQVKTMEEVRMLRREEEMRAEEPSWEICRSRYKNLRGKPTSCI